MNNPSIGSFSNVNVAAAVASGDIKTLIQMVQSDRVKLMDAQLVEQVKAVQARNDQIAKLNEVLAGLNGFNSKIEGKDSGDKIEDGDTAKEYAKPANDAIAAAGITDLKLSKDSTKGEIETAITKIKGMIDAESNNQQMDMLRLQSLNNKKNESVEILTTTQKKSNDSNSGIIRNF